MIHNPDQKDSKTIDAENEQHIPPETDREVVERYASIAVSYLETAAEHAAVTRQWAILERVLTARGAVLDVVRGGPWTGIGPDKRTEEPRKP